MNICKDGKFFMKMIISVRSQMLIFWNFLSYCYIIVETSIPNVLHNSSIILSGAPVVATEYMTMNRDNR